jgi:biopolymer transport protein ExbD
MQQVPLSTNVHVAMISGQLQIGVLHIDDVPIIERESKKKIIPVVDINDVQKVNHYMAMSTTQKRLATNRDTYVRVLAALIEAERFIRDPKNAEAVANQADCLVVAVTFRGTVFLEVTTVTPAQLSGKAKAQLTGHPGKRVYLKGDARTPYSTVAEVLEALRTAGVDAPILLTSQQNSTNAAYVPPMGLEVLLTAAPDAAHSVTLKAGNGRASDAELKQYARNRRHHR